MSNCPKCNHKLSLLDWRQTCPKCGVNLMYCGFEDRFNTDAKYAEMGFAKVRVKWARAKASLFGGKIQIARLCLSLLPLLAMLIPGASVSVAAPFYEKTFGIGGIGLYTAFSGGAFELFAALKGSGALSAAASAIFNTYIAFAATALSALLVLLFSLLCFLNAKVMARLVCISCGLGAVLIIVSEIFESRLSSAFSALPFAAQSGEGLLQTAAALAAFAIVFAVNFKIARRGIEVEYKDGDLYRCEVAKKLKKGEITLADISQPIYETQAERDEREAAIQGIMDEHKRADKEKEEVQRDD